MENFINIFDNIINDSNNQINAKISGINYLEKFKYHFIEIIQKSNLDFSTIEGKNEIKKNYGSKELVISIENYKESISNLKQTTLNDYLCIVLKGSKMIEIYENKNSKKSNSINLFKNNGITLSKDTIISESIVKNTLLINIFNDKINDDIEKI